MNTASRGAPPHPKPWPQDPRLDPVLLENSDTRNVINKYRYWTNEAIKADLKEHRFAYHVAIENYQHDFNIGTIVRNANAFHAHAVHVVGKRKWNRRGAMVTDKYLDVVHHGSVEEFISWAHAQQLPLIGIDNIKGSKKLSEVTFPEHCVLVLGQEGPGLSDEMKKACETLVGIEQFGSTRSVNVGVASGIIMYAWLQQHVLEA